MNKKSWLRLHRIVRFGDTDAAGVMHFHKLFRWCHESWEESLQNYGLTSADIFPGSCNSDFTPEVALPIVHCQADFRRALQTGHTLDVKLHPQQINQYSFQVHFEFIYERDLAAKALIRHLSINSQTRRRCKLPEGICNWLEASCVENLR